MHGPGISGTNFIDKTGLRAMINGRRNEPDLYSYCCLSGLYSSTIALHAGGGAVKEKLIDFIRKRNIV